MSQETLSVEQSETLQQLQQMQRGGAPAPEPKEDPLPQGAGPVEPKVEAQAPAEETPTPEPTEQIEVDGQTFANEKAALAYLQGKYSEVQTERLLDEARLEGMQSALQYAQPHTQAQPKVEEDDTIDMDLFYENPTEYMRQREKKIAEKLKAELMATQTAAQREAEAWGQFSKKYPDLADSREVVELVVNKNADMVRTLAARNQEKAMDFVARKTREIFQGYVEAQKPTKVLSNTRQETSFSSNPPVTQSTKKPSDNKPLDFASQLRSIRK